MKKLVLERTKICLMDASESNVIIFINRRTEFVNPPDFSGANVVKKVEE